MHLTGSDPVVIVGRGRFAGAAAATNERYLKQGHSCLLVRMPPVRSIEQRITLAGYREARAHRRFRSSDCQNRSSWLI